MTPCLIQLGGHHYLSYRVHPSGHITTAPLQRVVTRGIRAAVIQLQLRSLGQLLIQTNPENDSRWAALTNPCPADHHSHPADPHDLKPSGPESVRTLVSGGARFVLGLRYLVHSALQLSQLIKPKSIVSDHKHIPSFSRTQSHELDERCKESMNGQAD